MNIKEDINYKATKADNDFIFNIKLNYSVGEKMLINNNNLVYFTGINN